jgi:hypothetical protein
VLGERPGVGDAFEARRRSGGGAERYDFLYLEADDPHKFCGSVRIPEQVYSG